MKEKTCKGCKFKCSTCQYYDKKKDFCTSRSIVNCSKSKTEFTECTNYLVKDKLIMF